MADPDYSPYQTLTPPTILYPIYCLAHKPNLKIPTTKAPHMDPVL